MLLSTGFLYALLMSCLDASSVPVGVRERRVDAVDTEAIGQKVKQEFAAKDRVRKEVKPVPKSKKAA